MEIFLWDYYNIVDFQWHKCFQQVIQAVEVWSAEGLGLFEGWDLSVFYFFLAVKLNLEYSSMSYSVYFYYLFSYSYLCGVSCFIYGSFLVLLLFLSYSRLSSCCITGGSTFLTSSSVLLLRTFSIALFNILSRPIFESIFNGLPTHLLLLTHRRTCKSAV